MSGVIHAIGSRVEGFQVGDPVTVMPLDPCGDCPACQTGHSHICHNLKFLGIDTPGAFQSLWTVPAHTLYHLPDTLSLVHGALIEPLAVAFKRIINIMKQARQRGDIAQEPDRKEPKADPSLFQQPEEHALFTAFQKVKAEVSDELKTGAFDRALLTVATLRKPVDSFFDGVMVLTDDERVKQNRLALLGEIAHLFDVFADFSRIST